MWAFLMSAELWANILGGVAAAALVALFVQLRDKRRHRILRELTAIMGDAIKHRNDGEAKTYADEDEWVRRAKEIESEAIAKANELSSTAGSLIQWLDRVEPWHVSSERERYISILSKVIERIRELLERNS